MILANCGKLSTGRRYEVFWQHTQEESHLEGGDSVKYEGHSLIWFSDGWERVVGGSGDC